MLACCSVANAALQTEETDTLNLPGYHELQELVIEAERPVLQSDGATTTYNVEEDPSAESSTAMDILRKVPMVSVDGEGNIRLNGQSNFKMQVDGMENPMLQQYASQILNAMPASMIVKIEVITEPGAKQDAEGSAGIINFITQKKQNSDGYSGNIGMSVSNRSFGPSLYGIVKKNKVTVSANFNYQGSVMPQRGENHSVIDYLTGDSGSLETNTSQKTRFNFIGGNLNLSWEPNEKNLFTLGANVNNVHIGLNDILSETSMFGNTGTPLWGFSQDGSGKMNILSLSANASYRHNFAPEGNYLVFSYLFNFGDNDIRYHLLMNSVDNYLASDPFENRLSNSYNRGHTVQIDYANNFKSEHHLMEVGAKGIFRRNNALSKNYIGKNQDSPQFLSNIDNIRQPQDIYAGYGSYTGKFGQLTALAGIRYEHTRMGITDLEDPKQSFTTYLNDWVPNAALTWQFDGMTNLRAAYQMRISRPSLDQVNPFELALNPFEVRTGNPDLKSERSHKITLSYTNFGRVFGGNIGLEYTLVNNAISGYTYMRTVGNNNVLYTSYANIGKTNTAALTGFLNWSIIQHMNLSINGRLEYTTLKAPALGYSNHGWGGNIGGAWNYTAAKVNKFTAFGGWFARRLNVQGYNSSYYYYGVGASRDFLADRSLTIGINAINFLQKTISYSNYARTDETISKFNGKNLDAWNLGLSITWKFGSLQSKVKDTGVEVKNDDISTSSNKGEGSSGL